MKHVVWITLVGLGLSILLLFPASAGMVGGGAAHTAHPASETIAHPTPTARNMQKDQQLQPMGEPPHMCGQPQAETDPFRLMAQVGLTCSTSRGPCRLPEPRPIGETCCCPNGVCGEVAR